MKVKLDVSEKQIEKDASEYKPVSGAKRKKIESLLNSSRKAKNINIRISENDLERLRERSATEGLPYQTLISSIIHRYVTGQLMDESSILKAVQLLQSGKGKRSQ